jgi:hypothetical protein
MAAMTTLLLAAGCSSTGPKNVDNFVGTWTFSSGTFQATCPPPIPPYSNDLTGQTVTLTKGTSSDLVSTLQTMFGTCSLQLGVNGSMASASPGQTCSLTVTVAGTTLPVTLTVTSWTVTTAGLSMTTAAMGTASSSSGLVNNCPVILTGTASKGAAPADASAG